MEQHNYDKQHTLDDLASEYEAMSQKGTVVFYEETVFSQLIDYYENESAIDQALAVVDLALSQHHFSSKLHCKKAQLLAIQNCEEAAIKSIEKAEILSPGDIDIKLIKVNILSLLDNYSEAFSILEMLKGTCSPDDKEQLSEIYFSEGLLYERLHEYNSMFSALKQALTFNPNHDQALNRIWLCIEMSRNFEESIELCKQIIDNEPYCYMAWYNLGHAHTYFGNYEKAIEAYEYAFITNEEFEWAYRHCAELCMEIQNYSKALDCYEELLSHIQPDGELLFKIGQCYHFLGKTKIAQQFYKRSIKLDDINDEVYFYLGECAIQLNDWNRAIYYYKRAIEIEGKREEYYAALGKAYAFLDSFEKAFICFDRAIQLAPEQTVYWIEFADFLIGINAIDTALDVLKDAAEQAVGAEILYCKAACLFKINQRKNAMKVLEEALIEDFELHSLIFEYNPKLKNDKDIIAMLEFYKYES